MRQPWTGVGTALVTPFTPGGEVDEPRCAGSPDDRSKAA